MRKSLFVALILLLLGIPYVNAQKTSPPLIRQVIGSKRRASNPAVSFHKLTLPGSSILVGVTEQNRGIAATARIEDTQANSFVLLRMSPYVDGKSEWCAIYVARRIKGGLDEVRAQFSNGGGPGIRGLFIAEVRGIISSDDTTSVGGRTIGGPFPNMVLLRNQSTDLLFTVVNSEGNGSTKAPKGFSSFLIGGDGIAWSEHPISGDNPIQWEGKFNNSNADFSAAAVVFRLH